MRQELRAMIGKAHGRDVIDTIVSETGVYFAAIGGAAAL